MKLSLLACGLAASASLILAGQFGSLVGPRMGYMWSTNDGGLHPLLGIPGSSTFGPALDLGFTVSQATALDGTHFVASTNKHATAVAINLAASPSSTVEIAGAPAGPSAVAGSRSATTAALYYAAQAKVLIVTGLPASPRVSRTVDVSVASQELTRIAVSDDGELLLYAASIGERDALYAWTSAAGNRLLTTADSISDIALAPTGNAVVTDAKSSEVFSIVDPKGSAWRLVLDTDKNEVSNPSGVAVSSTGLIYVANAGNRTILTLDPSGRALRATACSCELARFSVLKDSLYNLSDKTDSTIYLLEAGASSDRILFVPPGRGN